MRKATIEDVRDALAKVSGGKSEASARPTSSYSAPGWPRLPSDGRAAERKNGTRFGRKPKLTERRSMAEFMRT